MAHGEQEQVHSAVPDDRTPERVEWIHREEELVYLYWNQWRKWRADFTAKHGWIKRRGATGRAEWDRLKEMVRAIETNPIRELLADPARYFRCKKRRPPPEGRYVMQYNNVIRLVFRYFLVPSDAAHGELVAEILDFGYHYEGLD